ncbi:MAG: YbaN family protein [Faecalibacterium sp.]
MKKIIYITVGTISLVCGYIGVIMPFIPFTPFLILTAFCYGKSSERLNTWFKNTKLYKENLESFVKGEGMTKQTKRRVMLAVTLVMAFGFVMMLGKAPLPALITLGAVWVAHIIYFVKMVKLKAEDEDDQ